MSLAGATRCTPDRSRLQQGAACHSTPLPANVRDRLPARRGRRGASASRGIEVRSGGERVRRCAVVRARAMAGTGRAGAAPWRDLGVPHEQRPRGPSASPPKAASPETASCAAFRRPPDHLAGWGNRASPRPRRVDPPSAIGGLRGRGAPRATRPGGHEGRERYDIVTREGPHTGRPKTSGWRAWRTNRRHPEIRSGLLYRDPGVAHRRARLPLHGPVLQVAVATC